MKNKVINAVEIGPLSHGEGASWVRLHANIKYLLRSHIRSLLHQRADRKPQ